MRTVFADTYYYLALASRRGMEMVTITFPDRETERRALALLPRRFSGRVFRSGEPGRGAEGPPQHAIAVVAPEPVRRGRSPVLLLKDLLRAAPQE